MTHVTLLNEKQAADFLTVGERCLQSWRFRGYGPSFFRVGRLIRYKQTDLETWLEAQVRQSTSDKGEIK